MSALPLLLETACRLGAVTHSELAEFRRGWAGIQAILAVNPSIAPSAVVTSIDFLGLAVPEIWRVQPRGIYRKIYTDGRYLHDEFARDLGGAIGAFPSQWNASEGDHLKVALRTLPPVFVESEARGFA